MTARAEKAPDKYRLVPARAPSPRPERGRAEQRLLRRRLRAPVLRRGFDLAAEFGGGVPAPARVVQYAARQRDHVGLARRDDVLGLFGFGDQADPMVVRPVASRTACANGT